MWSSIALWGGLTLGWWGLLWLLLPSGWAALNPGSLLMLHLAPPPALGLGLRAWEQLGSLRAQEDASEAEAAVHERQQAEDQAARARHAAQLAERQQVLECRGLYCVARPVEAAPAWVDETEEGWAWRSLAPAELDEGLEQGDGALRGGLAQEALGDVFGRTPGAAWLPLCTPLPEGLEPAPWLAQVQEAARSVLAGLSPWREGAPLPHLDVRLLPGSGALAGRVQAFLDQQPGLPGMVVLAQDGAALHALPAHEASDAWEGEALAPGGLACVALLFLRSGLEDGSAASAQVQDADPYRPYWEKRFVRPVPAWGPVPLAHQPALARLPVLGRLARGAFIQGADARKGQRLALQLGPVLDEALINGGLKDCPFCPEEANPALDRAAELGWLVHNCGPVDQAGTRLAALCNTLSLHQVELDPIDEASNSVPEWGDTGSASPSLLAALAITHARRRARPVLLAQFQADTASLGIVLPPITKELQS